MNKFLLLSAAALFSTSAFAQEYLSDGVITDGPVGKYVCTEWGMPSIGIQYFVDGQAVTFALTDAKIGYYEWDVDHEDPFEYIEVEINVPGETEPRTVNAVVTTDQDYGIMSTRDAGTESGDMLQIQTGELWDLQWPGGEYSFTLDEGIIATGDGTKNPEQEFKFNALGSFFYVADSAIDPYPADPSEGQEGIYTQEELKNVTITFETEVFENEGDIRYVNNGTSTVLDAKYITLNETELVLDLSFLEEGTYDIEIPSGYLVTEDQMFSGKTFTYTIWNGLPVAEVLDGPEAVGLYVRNLSLSYGQAIQPAVDEYPAIGVYDYYYEEAEPLFTIPGENVSIVEIPMSDGSDQPSTELDETTTEPTLVPVLYIDIIEAFADKTGQFTIVIPEGIVENEAGLKNPSQQISFTLTQLYAYEPELVLSEDGVLDITWKDATYVSGNDSVKGYLTLPDGSKEEVSFYNWIFGTGQVEVNNTYDGVVVTLTELLTEPGDYELVLPQGFFNISGYDEDNEKNLDGINGEIIFEFTYDGNATTGVENITVAPVVPAVEGIYNLQGVRVSENNLGKGLYIINGKKVLVK